MRARRRPPRVSWPGGSGGPTATRRRTPAGSCSRCATATPGIRLDPARGEVTVWAGVSMDQRDAPDRAPGLVRARHRRAPATSRSAARWRPTSTARTTTCDGLLRQPRLVVHARAGRRHDAPRDAGRRRRRCSGRRRAAWASPASSPSARSGRFPIETSRILVDTERATDLDDVLSPHDRGRRAVPLLGGLDRPAGPRRSARAQRAHPGRPRAAVGAVRRRAARPARRSRPSALAAVPPIVPTGLLNHATVRAFNEVWYRKAPAPADRAHHVDLAVLPPARRGAPLEPPVRTGAGSCSTSSSCRSAPSRRCGGWSRRWSASACPRSSPCSKRFGAANPGPLSFPMPGWTLALDIPARLDGLGPVCSAARRAGARGGRPALPGQGRPHRPGRGEGGLPAARRVAGRPRPRSIPTGSGSRTSAAASGLCGRRS